MSNTISLDFGVMSAPFSSITGVSSMEFAVSIEAASICSREAIFPAFSKSLNTMKEAITKIKPSASDREPSSQNQTEAKSNRTLNTRTTACLMAS